MRIYTSTTTDFTNNGLGFLTDIISAEITEELNGGYSLSFVYPTNGILSEYIEEDNLVKSKVSDGSYQVFRIKRVVKDYTKIEVYAEHIFYDLLNNFLLDIAPTNLDCNSFGTWILSKTNFATNFSFYSDITGTKSARYVRRNPIEAIMGDIDNSMVNLFGGDIERDNYTIKLLAQRGLTTGIKLIFGKNIKEIKITTDSSSIVTRLLPLGFDGLMLPEYFVDSQYINDYQTPRIAKVEFSNIKYDPDDETAYQTKDSAYEALRQASQELFNTGIDRPQINIKVDWIELSKTEEYKAYQALETLHLGDYVIANILGLNYETRIVKIVYNPLTDTTEKFEIGTIQRNIGNSVNINTQRVEQVNPVSILQSAKNNATEQINNAMGGYIVKTQTDLYIMDTNDTATAQKVWRWNLNGLGYSNTGIGGPYQVAMNANGQIVADMITTGTMSADRIQGLNGISFYVGQLGDYIRITEDGKLVIGTAESEFTLVEENDGIAIYNGSIDNPDNRISFWKQDGMKLKKLYLGNFAFIPRDNGSLGFRKVE